MTVPLPLEERLDSVETLERHLARLLELDPRLHPVAETAGAFPLRINPPGFAGMAKIIIGQQVSVASARAIWSRFELVPGALEAASYAMLSEQDIEGVGLSGFKKRTIRAIAEAVAAGDLDFERLPSLSADEAVAELTRHKGIGPWTAEVYLMFCAAHPDVFPAGDLALQKAVGQGLGLAERPPARQLVEIARAWAPHRATAALLFWRYFAVMRDREGILL
ncbi:DNA-3-methyladenine glycosylase family protein [Paradevosia shaoguanensis]|uniref:DNA-3-methyladenine glycosylase II n=1 Tax=Paradevosia shaoguanensis TaxID=1335043 RepID=A0AA41QSE6_9HYPH|nr:DNA-3-methyladenine glycosylase [Paradevosia shaoguanensis]MCF1745000.1 DNA-3-methyladenine glycosylase [Paradevosia shaoguanensis]MCI0129483.1 DNA-3-methyladenine glycosylase [Paradevosia shaoguanensis]